MGTFLQRAAYRGRWLAVLLAGMALAGWGLSASRRGDRQPPAAGRHHRATVHDHPHAWVELSPEAERNLGVRVEPVGLSTWENAITIPAMVVARPGRTMIQVVAPMTGVVGQVRAVEGEAIEPGRVLFTIRLTHEDLVAAQTAFLQTLEELEVENREITRLQELSQQGVIAGRTLLDRQYARDKLTALQKVQRQALLLHGLTEPQIQQIEQSRFLIREVSVTAPQLGEMSLADSDSLPLDRGTASPPGMLSLHEVNAHPNQFVHAGEQLAMLADLTKLYIEGRAFEQDASTLVRTANRGWQVTAILQDRAQDPVVIPGLDIVYVSNKVDPETRAFYFYVELPNVPLRDVVRDGHRFVSWRHKPGQRLELLVPVERMEEQIVLPRDAVAEQGPETFVFVRSDGRFHRRPVHISHRRQHEVVVEQDGSLRPGERVAISSAHQLQMAFQQANDQALPADHHGHMH